MKTSLLISSLLLGATAFAVETDSTGLEGDHLDLSGVLEIFKESESPEDFEKRLNTESSKVNNLDLDGDGEVDYIRIVDSGDSTSHVLTLQVPINNSESQDVATIELEETDQDVVEIQIVGDEELYGKDYILLPESAGRGPVVINVIMWRPVRFMWAPRYRPWVSPWRYRAYPGWYHPWKRRSWRSYRNRVVVYRGGCRRVYRRNFTHAHAHHYHRTHSATFHKNHHHKHTGKSAGTSNSSGKQVKHTLKSNSISPKSGSKSTTSKPTKNATQPNTKKVTTTHSSSPAPAAKPAATQKKTASPDSRKRPGTKATNSRKRPGTSSGTKKGGKSSRSRGGNKK